MRAPGARPDPFQVDTKNVYSILRSVGGRTRKKQLSFIFPVTTRRRVLRCQSIHTTIHPVTLSARSIGGYDVRTICLPMCVKLMFPLPCSSSFSLQEIYYPFFSSFLHHIIYVNYCHVTFHAHSIPRSVGVTGVPRDHFDRRKNGQNTQIVFL